MGVNQAAAFSGSFIGLIVGGLLAPFDWRLIFLVSVPVGLLGTIWGYRSLRELGERHHAHVDWLGNATFAVGKWHLSPEGETNMANVAHFMCELATDPEVWAAWRGRLPVIVKLLSANPSVSAR